MKKQSLAFGLLPLGLIVAVVCVLFTRLASDRRRESSGTHSASNGQVQGPLSGDAVDSALAEPRSALNPSTRDSLGDELPKKVRAADYLMDYWGSRWPEVEEEILDRWAALGLDGKKEVLDLEIDPACLPTWEEIEVELQEKVVRTSDAVLNRLTRAYADLSDTTLNYHLDKAGKKPSEEYREALRQAAASVQPEMIEAVLTLATEELRYRQRVWDEKLYAAGPVAAAGGPAFLLEAGDGASGSLAVKGWGLHYRLEPSQDYGYMLALQRVQELSRIRTQAILDALRSL